MKNIDGCDEVSDIYFLILFRFEFKRYNYSSVKTNCFYLLISFKIETFLYYFLIDPNINFFMFHAIFCGLLPGVRENNSVLYLYS